LRGVLSEMDDSSSSSESSSWDNVSFSQKSQPPLKSEENLQSSLPKEPIVTPKDIYLEETKFAEIRTITNSLKKEERDSDAEFVESEEESFYSEDYRDEGDLTWKQLSELGKSRVPALNFYHRKNLRLRPTIHDEHRKTISEVLKRFSTCAKTGLTETERQKRLETFGPNLEQNALHYQWSKEQMDLRPLTLQKLESYWVLVDGVWQKVVGTSLVPGDIIMVTAGQIIPADIRVINARGAYMEPGNFATANGKMLSSKTWQSDGMNARCIAFHRAHLVFGVFVGVVIATDGATVWATQRYIVHPFKFRFSPDVRILMKCATDLNIVVRNVYAIPALSHINYIFMNIDFLLHFSFSTIDAVYYDGKVCPLEEIDRSNRTWKQLHKAACVASDATIINGKIFGSALDRIILKTMDKFKSVQRVQARHDIVTTLSHPHRTWVCTVKLDKPYHASFGNDPRPTRKEKDGLGPLCVFRNDALTLLSHCQQYMHRGKRCQLTEQIRKQIQEDIILCSKQRYLLYGYAYSESSVGPLCWIGFLCIRVPLHPSFIKESIQTLKSLNISLMLSGLWNVYSMIAIVKEIGLEVSDITREELEEVVNLVPDPNNELQQRQHHEKEQRIISQYNTKVFACDALHVIAANVLTRIAEFKVSILARALSGTIGTILTPPVYRFLFIGGDFADSMDFANFTTRLAFGKKTAITYVADLYSLDKSFSALVRLLQEANKKRLALSAPDVVKFHHDCVIT
jgi:hypothetical protein